MKTKIGTIKSLDKTIDYHGGIPLEHVGLKYEFIKDAHYQKAYRIKKCISKPYIFLPELGEGLSYYVREEDIVFVGRILNA